MPADTGGTKHQDGDHHQAAGQDCPVGEGRLRQAGAAAGRQAVPQDLPLGDVRQRVRVLRRRRAGAIEPDQGQENHAVLRSSLLLKRTGNQREPQRHHQEIPAQGNILRLHQDEDGERSPGLDEHLPKKNPRRFNPTAGI